jgi:hypothetical protein
MVWWDIQMPSGFRVKVGRSFPRERTRVWKASENHHPVESFIVRGRLKLVF